MATKNALATQISVFGLMLFLIGSTVPVRVNAEKIKRAYLDNKKNVHIVTVRNRHTQITNKGNSIELKLAPDNETIAWMVMNNWIAEGDTRPGSEELVIYRNGKIASLKCSPFIRNYWFWKNGLQIAIDCGGRHFAGREFLYDIKTLKEISSLDANDVP